MMRYKDIVEINDNFDFIGIIDKIHSLFPSTLLFLNSENVKQIDNAFFIHSGKKLLSTQFIDIKEMSNVDTAMSKMAKTIVLQFGENWNKIYTAYFETNYKPLENYSMIEEETPNLTESITHSKTGNNKTSTQTNINSTNSNDGNQSTYGFNGTTAVPTNTQSTNGTSNVTGNENDNYNKVVIDESETSQKTNTGNRQLTRSGNIGVTTSQQMLESEIKLREFDFYTKVFDDIDSILCSQIYLF